MSNVFHSRVPHTDALGIAVRVPRCCRIAATPPVLMALCLLAAMGVDSARAQQVESIFIAGVSSDGYYVANDSMGKLEVAILGDLQEERPINLGARVEVLKHDHALQTVSFPSTAELVGAGRRASGGRDQWYLPIFLWVIGCSSDGQAVTFNGDTVGQSPVDFIIEAGVAVLDPATEEMILAADTIARSSKKRVVCGTYAPLPVHNP
jgi:hypothetical protein